MVPLFGSSHAAWSGLCLLGILLDIFLGVALLCYTTRLCLALLGYALRCLALLGGLLCFPLHGFAWLCWALPCLALLCLAACCASFCLALLGFAGAMLRHVWLSFALFCFAVLCFAWRLALFGAALHSMALLCACFDFCFSWRLAVLSFAWLWLALLGYVWLC